MKRYLLKLFFMSISIIFNLKSSYEKDYNIDVGIKNLMRDPTSGIKLKYREGSGVFRDGKYGNTGEYNLGVIAPSTLTETGKIWVNRLTLGKTTEDAHEPSKVTGFTVTYRPTSGVCSSKTDVGGFCIIESSGEWSAKDPLHGVILPNGKVVQVAQLYYDGGIKLLDGYIIYSDGHVTHSVNDPKSTIPVPAGKTKPMITESGTLGWE